MENRSDRFEAQHRSEYPALRSCTAGVPNVKEHLLVRLCNVFDTREHLYKVKLRTRRSFSLKPNHPLSDRCMGYIVKKFEQVGGRGGGIPKWTSLNMWSHGDPPHLDRLTDRHDWKHYLSAMSFSGGKHGTHLFMEAGSGVVVSMNVACSYVVWFSGIGSALAASTSRASGKFATDL